MLAAVGATTTLILSMSELSLDIGDSTFFTALSSVKVCVIVVDLAV